MCTKRSARGKQTQSAPRPHLRSTPTQSTHTALLSSAFYRVRLIGRGRMSRTAAVASLQEVLDRDRRAPPRGPREPLQTLGPERLRSYCGGARFPGGECSAETIQEKRGLPGGRGQRQIPWLIASVICGHMPFRTARRGDVEKPPSSPPTKSNRFRRSTHCCRSK